MPAVSKKQQRFFGIVRAIQKGEMAPTTPETAKAAADMKKSDVKDFASTKHKKLPEKKVAKEAADFSQRDKIMKKAKPLHKHLFKNLHKGDRKGDVNETTKYDRYDKEKKQFAKADRRMKFGKFYDKAKEAKNRLRPGEVKRYDKKLGRYVSNKE
jgi:tetrahydrodipicolinate N-succinyltransferase